MEKQIVLHYHGIGSKGRVLWTWRSVSILLQTRAWIFSGWVTVGHKGDYNKNLQVIQSNIQAFHLSIRHLVILSETLQFDTQLFWEQYKIHLIVKSPFLHWTLEFLLLWFVAFLACCYVNLPLAVRLLFLKDGQSAHSFVNDVHVSITFIKFLSPPPPPNYIFALPQI
jgi:hypothetical protein